jgi:catechol 2,3-dioxygenase-like lactoylglutathione lyase family enzyme
MKPSITVITLGVTDLERSLVFYRDGLGLPTEGIIGTELEHGAVVFFRMTHGLILALWPQASLAAEANVAADTGSTVAFSLAHNVDSREEVDAVMAQAEQAGATISDPARDRFFGGYAGYFRDPDGHLWEIAWNPGFAPAE